MRLCVLRERSGCVHRGGGEPPLWLGTVVVPQTLAVLPPPTPSPLPAPPPSLSPPRPPVNGRFASHVLSPPPRTLLATLFLQSIGLLCVSRPAVVGCQYHGGWAGWAASPPLAPCHGWRRHGFLLFQDAEVVGAGARPRIRLPDKHREQPGKQRQPRQQQRHEQPRPWRQSSPLLFPHPLIAAGEHARLPVAFHVPPRPHG